MRTLSPDIPHAAVKALGVNVLAGVISREQGGSLHAVGADAGLAVDRMVIQAIGIWNGIATKTSLSAKNNVAIF